jgi:hypothetical protein
MKTDDNKIQHVNQVTTNMRNTWPNMAAKDTPQDIAKKKRCKKMKGKSSLPSKPSISRDKSI